MLSPFMQRKVAEGFLHYDVTRDGRVGEDDFVELGRRVAQNLGVSPDSARYADIVNKYRVSWQGWANGRALDSDGTISIMGWLANTDAAWGQLSALPDKGKQFILEANKALFDALDEDDNGQVSREEFAAHVMAFGATADQAAKAFKALDLNHNNTLSSEEVGTAWYEFWFADDPNAPGNWFFGGV